MALRRLLALAAAATVAADVVQVAVLCDSRTAAGRAECDMSIAAVDAINNKTDGVFDDLLPSTYINLTVAYEGCGEKHPVTGVGDDAFEVWKSLPVQPIASIGPWCSSKVKEVASAANREKLGSNAVVISPASTSTSISDRDEYPNVVRLSSTEAIVQQALGVLSGEHYNWKRVAVVYNALDVWASDAAKVFAQTIEASGGEVLGGGVCVTSTCPHLDEAGPVLRGIRFDGDQFDASPVATANAILDELDAVGARIVYLVVLTRQQRPLFQQVKLTGKMYGSGFAWLSGWLDEDVLIEDDGNPNIDAIEGAEGALMAGEYPDFRNDVFKAFAEQRRTGISKEACTGERQPGKYCDIDDDPNTIGTYAAQSIDCVLTLAKALDTLDVADRQDPNKIYAAISGLGEFQGATGRVVLDGLNERQGSMTVTNLQLIVGGVLGNLRRNLRRLAVLLSETVADFVPVGKIVDGEFIENGPDSGVVHTDGEYYSVKFPGDTKDVPKDRDDKGSGSSKKGKRDVAWWVWLAIFGTIGGVLICIACGLATLRVRGELKRKRKLEKTNTLMVQNQVRAAIESVDHFSAPFQLVRASALYACSKLPLHETLRSEGELVAVDRIEDVAENYSLASTGGARAIVFFSHQWLGNDDCDPQNIQFQTIKAALQSVATRARLTLDDLFVWADVCSIPQRNAGIKGFSIVSLPAYAGASDFFVAIVPEAPHADSGEVCSRETYLKRAWCRAEIFAFFVRRGPAFMYYLDAPDADLEPMLPSADGSCLPDDFLGTVDVCVEINQCVGCTRQFFTSHFSAMTRPSWLSRAARNRHRHAIEQASRRWRGGRRDDSARTRRKTLISTQVDVFHGDMTCCKMGHNNGTTPCDQEKLVKPMLGLLVELYRDRHDDAAARVIWNAIEPNLAKLYPKNFDYACGPGGRTERRALFGDLVTAMYYYFEDHGDAAVPHFAPGATALLSPRFRRSSNTSPPETIRSLMTGSSGPSLRHIIRPSLESGATVSPDLESTGLPDEPESGRPAKHVSFAAETKETDRETFP